jgi:hypothetical protein
MVTYVTGFSPGFERNQGPQIAVCALILRFSSEILGLGSRVRPRARDGPQRISVEFQHVVRRSIIRLAQTGGAGVLLCQ